jgi:hypothetical protein
MQERTFLFAPLIFGSPSSFLSNLPMLPVDTLLTKILLSNSFFLSSFALPLPSSRLPSLTLIGGAWFAAATAAAKRDGGFDLDDEGREVRDLA